MRPKLIDEIMEQANEGSDNISNDDWSELKTYIEELEAQK